MGEGNDLRKESNVVGSDLLLFLASVLFELQPRRDWRIDTPEVPWSCRERRATTSASLLSENGSPDCGDEDSQALVMSGQLKVRNGPTDQNFGSLGDTKVVRRCSGRRVLQLGLSR